MIRQCKKKWKAFTRKIDTKTDDFGIVLKTINTFLAKQFTATVSNLNGTEKWSASKNMWEQGGI